MEQLVAEQTERLAILAQRHGVLRLDVFGSATNNSFDAAHSDLDFLVTFVDHPPGGMANAYFGLLEDLQQLFDRDIDLVTQRSIRNPYFQASLEASRQPVYVA